MSDNFLEDARVSKPSFLKTFQVLTVLGSTGSIGTSTLDVVLRHPDNFKIFALTANSNVDILVQQCLTFKPNYAVMLNKSSARELKAKLHQANSKTEVLMGKTALIRVVEDSSVDTVMAAIVGAAGLLPTLAAVKANKKVLLANKEALVMAGGLFMTALHNSQATLLPIDSEHNAIFQCLPIADNKPNASNNTRSVNGYSNGVKKLLLTGSGGPFREWPLTAINSATPDQACNHPNWSMGRKISVDSATLMNKGLELIEARWLFGVKPNDIEVVIHPQSIIHSMVEYVDGSVLAQLGHPDMRTPIAHALAWPDRIDAGVDSLDFMSLSRLTFEKPDFERFPALSLAISVASMPTSAATVLNAANEIAVQAFLEGRISFGHIALLLEQAIAATEFFELPSIEAVLDVDLRARKLAGKIIESFLK
jgi:1-deoxy-D-xylulose-5-phosphate reductoisomerase